MAGNQLIMVDNQLWDRLRTGLIGLMDVEGSIRATADELRTKVSSHPAARAIVSDICGMAGDHINSIRDRLVSADGSDPGAPANNAQPRSGETWLSDLHPVSSSLRVMYTRLNEAVIGYSMITPIATRARDSSAIADEGTTMHVTRQHTQDYMGVVGQITALIHDVIIWELDRDGTICRCTCPCCSIGVCAGAYGSRRVLDEAWLAARPMVPGHGVELTPPRPGSAAALAGFMRGDTIIAVDGQKVDYTPSIARVITDGKAGDLMEFTVRRKAGEAKVMVVHRREGIDLNKDQCMLPAGQGFYLEQARDVKRRLHEQGSANGANGAGLSDLSARELQVLRLVAQGATNPIVANELEISRATVARHVAAILAKMGLTNRTEAATVASQSGLLPDV